MHIQQPTKKPNMIQNKIQWTVTSTFIDIMLQNGRVYFQQVSGVSQHNIITEIIFQKTM